MAKNSWNDYVPWVALGIIAIAIVFLLYPAAFGRITSVDAAFQAAGIGSLGTISSSQTWAERAVGGVTGFFDKLTLWVKVIGLVLVGLFVYASTRKNK